MAQALIQKLTATAAGVQSAPIGAPGGGMFATYGLQVKGTGGTPTSWTVLLEASLDRTNWTTLITHNATDGSTSYEATGKPNVFTRINVTALTLGPATDIKVTSLSTP